MGRIALAAVLIAALGAGLWWAVGGFSDPERRKLEQIQAEAPKNFKEMTPARMKSMRDQVASLPERLQKELREAMVKTFVSQMTAEAKKYCEITDAAQRQAFMQEKIREQEALRKQFASAAQNDKSSNGPPAGPPPGGGGPPGRGGPPSDADRAKFLRRILDSTGAYDRAYMAEFIHDMMKERERQGLSGGFGPR